MNSDLAKVKSLIRKYRGRKQALIGVLQDIQEKLHWLPPEVLEHVAADLEIPLADVYGVATFFKSFSLRRRGRHICTICLGTACHVRGGQAILDHLERKLGLQVGRTSDDFTYTLERVNCLGACALAPLVVIDGRYHGQMSVAKADGVLKQVEDKEGLKAVE